MNALKEALHLHKLKLLFCGGFLAILAKKPLFFSFLVSLALFLALPQYQFHELIQSINMKTRLDYSDAQTPLGDFATFIMNLSIRMCYM